MRYIKRIMFLLFFLIPAINYAIISYKLPNGFTVILDSSKNFNLTSFQIWVKTGSVYEQNYYGSGISHFIEHLLFTTTKKHTTEEISSLMKKYSCDMNGFTSFENTVYHFTFPSDNLKKVLTLAKEMIFMPAFKSSQIKKERKVILNEINMGEDNPDRYFSKLIFKYSYINAPYKFPVIGEREIFKSITREDLIKYYKARYIPENIALVLCGNFELNKGKKLISEIFGKIKPQKGKTVVLPPEERNTGYREFIFKDKRFKLPRLALVWKTVNIAHKDLYPLDLLSSILTEGKSSLLVELLKNKKGYVQNVSSFSYTPSGRGIFVIKCEVKNSKNVFKTKDEIIKFLKNFKITKEELEKAKRKFIYSYYKEKESVVGYGISLGINWVLTGNPEFSKVYLEGIKRVTPEMIKNVIKKYFVKENLTVIAVSDRDIRETKEEIKEEKNKIEVLNPSKNFTLILNKNKKLPIISFAVIFKGGRMVESDEKAGLTYFLSKMLLKGTGKFTRYKLLKLIEDNGGFISEFCGYNTFGFKGEILKENSKIIYGIINEILTNCSFPEEEFKKTKEEILLELKQETENIFAAGKRFLFKKCYKSSPYRILYKGTTNTIKNISLKDLKQAYNKFCKNGKVVISLSGDFDREEVLKFFSNKRKRKDSFKLKESVYNSGEFKKSIDKEQSLILAGYPGIAVTDKKRHYIDILWQILNSQGGRLFNEIREKGGMVYYVGMFPFYGWNTGMLIFYAGTTRKNINKIVNKIKSEVKKLYTKGITEDELTSGKKLAIAEKLKSFELNSNIAFDTGLDYIYNQRVEDIEEYKKEIDKIDKNSFNKFLKELFYKKSPAIIILEGKK